MDYFWIKQDRRVNRTPTIEDVRSVLNRQNLTMQKAHNIQERNVVFSNLKFSENYLDILDTQFFMVSKKIKKVISLYDETIEFKFFCILNNMLGEYANYYVPIFHEVDGYSPNSEANLNRSYIKTLVLNKKVVSDFSIFKLANVNTDVIIARLDVVESLLRREVHGVQIVKANLE